MATKKAPAKAVAKKTTKSASTGRTSKVASRPKFGQPIDQTVGYVRMMLYGYPGIGKTTFLGTGPRTLILANNADEVVSIKKAAKAGGSARNISIEVCADHPALDAAYEYLRHGGHKEFSWVWQDNGSLWQDQNMDRIMAELVKRSPHRSRYKPDKAEFGLNQQEYGQWVRDMLNVPINFGITAHVMQKPDPVSGDELVMPLFQGGQGEFSQKLCGYMNIVCYVTMSSKSASNRIFNTAFNHDFTAKDRFGVLKPKEVNLTIPKLMAAIKKG